MQEKIKKWQSSLSENSDLFSLPPVSDSEQSRKKIGSLLPPSPPLPESSVSLEVWGFFLLSSKCELENMTYKELSGFL